MNKKLDYSTVVFDVDNYSSRTAMFNAIGQQLQLLTENGYEAYFFADDVGCGIYVVEFAHNNRGTDYGSDRLMWVTQEEEEQVLMERNDDDEVIEEEDN